MGKKETFRIKISFDTTGYNKDPDGFKEMKNEMIKDYPAMLESTENLMQQWKDNDIIGTDEVKEQTEPFQRKVKAKHKKMKLRLIGKGKGQHTAWFHIKRSHPIKDQNLHPLQVKMLNN
jgi:hypothetical protein